MPKPSPLNDQKDPQCFDTVDSIFDFEFPMAMAVLKLATIFMQLAFSQDWEI